MKKIHLLCNAHLDPAWLWRRDEGLAEAISTFRVAADFCEKYDAFVFNHNEALLYEWVEEHEPELFERIKVLVKEGKWKIMGGWYLQPDCVMTSGESLLSQIDLGRKYFKEKFGVIPTTAINFDPFGHTRGLVQILKKCGYDSYIFMRPGSFKGDFFWEGFDGSRILAHGINGGYLSLKGDALNKVKRCMGEATKDNVLILWGIGNHGGGPSEIDLNDINAFIEESEDAIVHSSAEEYFSEVDTSSLPIISESLIPSMIGCYTSMVRIKQANRRLENSIALTEKIMSYAHMSTDFRYDTEELDKAKKALTYCQFHDILPGSAVEAVENDSLKTLDYACEITDNLYIKAFLKLCRGQKKAEQGTIPIMVFNPHPYEVEGEFTVEFMLENQNWNDDEATVATVYDENGNKLVSQNEKPSCTFNLDWIQRVCFKGKLKPSCVTRFNCTLEALKKGDDRIDTLHGDSITVSNENMTVSISRKTGLIELYKVNGRVLIENSGILKVYKDNEDPWGMTVDGFNDYEGEFTLMSDKDANAYIGYPDETMPNVRIVENGDVRMKVQAFFQYNRSTAVIEYTIPKNNTYMDVDIQIFSNEVNRMIKYETATKVSGTPYGETAFGEEALYSDFNESVFHKWCGIRSEDASLYILNKGTYGGCFSNDTIRLSLLRTPIYSAHPIRDRQIAPHTRFIKHIDMGQREFSFRLTSGENLERQAQLFNEEPRLLSFFPSGAGEKIHPAIEIDNPNIILSSMRYENGRYKLTLHNFSNSDNTAVVKFFKENKEITLDFTPYELKFIEL